MQMNCLPVPALELIDELYPGADLRESSPSAWTLGIRW